jgi:hypothetical protein
VAFADLQKANATFIANHALGEAIEYRAAGRALWSPLKAMVTRNPVDAIGQVLANTIELVVSRTDVVKVTIGQDEFRLLADKPAGGGTNPVYRVSEVLTRGSGLYQLRCVK